MNWGATIWGNIINGHFSLFKILGLGWVLCISSLSFAQVGVNTSNPQEKLHLAGSSGTLRVESLDHINNPFNGGDANADGDFSNDTYPLYVDENGDFTLQLSVLENTGSTDALDDTTLTTNMVTLLVNDIDGTSTTEIKSYNIVLSRPTLLEVKYNISHQIYFNNFYTPISDGLARKVENYITISPDPDPSDGISNRKYGPSGRSYTSASGNSVTGPFYNGHTTYIKFEPNPGVPTAYTIRIMGLVSSNIRGGNSGNIAEPAYVEFATDSDFLFFRLY